MSIESLSAAVPGGFGMYYVIASSAITLLVAAATRNPLATVIASVGVCVGATLLGLVEIWTMMLCIASSFLMFVAINAFKPRRT